MNWFTKIFSKKSNDESNVESNDESLHNVGMAEISVVTTDNKNYEFTRYGYSFQIFSNFEYVDIESVMDRYLENNKNFGGVRIFLKDETILIPFHRVNLISIKYFAYEIK